MTIQLCAYQRCSASKSRADVGRSSWNNSLLNQPYSVGRRLVKDSGHGNRTEKDNLLTSIDWDAGGTVSLLTWKML